MYVLDNQIHCPSLLAHCAACILPCLGTVIQVRAQTSAFISLLQEIRINMHEPGSKTTTTSSSCGGGLTGTIPGGLVSSSGGGCQQTNRLHNNNSSRPRHRVLAGGAILQPSASAADCHAGDGRGGHAATAAMHHLEEHGSNMTLLPPSAGNMPQQPQVMQPIPCKKNLQKMLGISPSDIDKYSRIFFPISFTCFNLMYWIIYLHVSDEIADDLMMLDGTSG